MSAMERLAGLGWNAEVPANGFHNRCAAPDDPYNDNPQGLDTPIGEVEIETTPEHRNLVSGDPRCATWTRTYDDPGVVALRARMRERNGIPGLEVCSPDEVERATTIFHRDGFVAIRDAVPPDQLERLRAAAADVIEQLVAADPAGAVGGAPYTMRPRMRTSASSTVCVGPSSRQPWANVGGEGSASTGRPSPMNRGAT